MEFLESQSAFDVGDEAWMIFADRIRKVEIAEVIMTLHSSRKITTRYLFRLPYSTMLLEKPEEHFSKTPEEVAERLLEKCRSE